MTLYIVKAVRGQLFLVHVKPDLKGSERSEAYRFGTRAKAEEAKRRIEKIPGWWVVEAIEWDQQQGREKNAV